MFTPSHTPGGKSKERINQTLDLITMEYNMVKDLYEDKGRVQHTVNIQLSSHTQNNDKLTYSVPVTTPEIKPPTYSNPFANLTADSGVHYQENSDASTYQPRNESAPTHAYPDMTPNQTVDTTVNYQEAPAPASTERTYPDANAYSNDTASNNLADIRARIAQEHNDRETV
jgi:hypothetical protein